MKKKNLIILLVFPFLISVFCIITVNTTYNAVDVDISHIDWEYNEVEAFKVTEGSKYELSAVGVNQRYYAVSGGNALVWEVINEDPDDPHARIVKEGGKYYLEPLRPGEVVVTCSNEKGNVQRRLNVVLYDNAAVLLYPTVSASQSNIDPVIYYGEYDHEIGNPAKIKMTLMALPAAIKDELTVEHSDNVTYDRATDTVNIVGVGDAYIRISDPSGRAQDTTYEFKIVDEGVNVYTYDDLLYCTNRSTGGHIAVLRVHFESLENAYMMNGNSVMVSGGEPVKKSGVNNVECFGNYDYKTKSFSFESEIFSFATTYNRSFIDQWNEFAKNSGSYSEITDKVKVGLHVTCDFYGNGYTVNLHNLTYPYSYSVMVNERGEEVRIPSLSSANLFRGPLKLYALGDPSNVPLVALYGQDNIGMYVEGDGIVVNDVNLKNCDFGDRMENLDTVGTVMEIYGDNITVKNSRLSNGKNVVRAFSSMNFSLENSLLSSARNFLLVMGSNEYEPVDLDRPVTFTSMSGQKVTTTLGEYVASKAEGDATVNTFLQNYFATEAERETMRAALISIQTALNGTKDISKDFRGSATVTDCYFYRSGITAICMESLFNSAFLETGSAPSLITDIFSSLNTEGKALVPYTATGVSGVSYPVKLTVTGDSRFYDYKEVGKIDLNGLIEENISSIANNLGLYEGTITIDDIFPLQSMISQNAGVVGGIHTADGKRYYNIPVAYYGGGLNLSTVEMDVTSSTNKVEVDLLGTYLNLKGSSSGGMFANLRGLMLKTVTSVTGFEPFAFHFVTGGYLYGETPSVSDLIANAEGAATN